MSKVIKIDHEPKNILKDYLQNLLETKQVSAIFSLRRLKNGKVDYALFTDFASLDFIEPFYPMMPVNAGQQLGKFTPLEKPIAAVVKPCEFRAFVEMVKREQVRREDFIIITYTCGGVYPLGKDAHKEIDKKLDNYWQQLKESNVPGDIRPTCRGCELINPQEADIYFDLTGKENKIWLRSDIAVNLLEYWHEEAAEGEFDDSILAPLLSKRKEAKKALFDRVDTIKTGLDGLIDIFGRCIGCHGCNSVCPICYCALCDFDSFNYDYNRQILEKELKQKGALRLPPDTLFFHLGRLSHMSFSCVGCGMCTDVCPASIPVAAVFKKTGEATAALFDFEAGRSIKEEIPVMIFKEEEFPELGE